MKHFVERRARPKQGALLGRNAQVNSKAGVAVINRASVE